ncbi:2-amino-4-oxopentanoate thiolase subunit OrtA [Facklamia lactis]|uniref:2-amino-4-oxopentanoate thiolase subunit OrtA n=1 Tax=Facklamia lactis TaxID=2749967 RepID=UPI0018CE5567|nr:2-amino-4-oxopentanoate thiolase subunit OrtA [Facklamia lactis]MBG9980126.1 2-amino-4-ketopentanoate thiolase [Facklamia lactis]
MAKKGEWVQIKNIVLSPTERAPQVPEDTKQVPLVMWVKGFLNNDGEIGEEVQITTVTGREVVGELVVEQPYFDHSFGEYVPEITEIHSQLSKEMEEV